MSIVTMQNWGKSEGHRINGGKIRTTRQWEGTFKRGMKN